MPLLWTSPKDRKTARNMARVTVLFFLAVILFLVVQYAFADVFEPTQIGGDTSQMVCSIWPNDPWCLSDGYTPGENGGDSGAAGAGDSGSGGSGPGGPGDGGHGGPSGPGNSDGDGGPGGNGGNGGSGPGGGGGPGQGGGNGGSHGGGHGGK
jgi:hypothetical protein